jgi:hypothetical protein
MDTWESAQEIPITLFEDENISPIPDNSNVPSTPLNTNTTTTTGNENRFEQLSKWKAERAAFSAWKEKKRSGLSQLDPNSMTTTTTTPRQQTPLTTPLMTIITPARNIIPFNTNPVTTPLSNIVVSTTTTTISNDTTTTTTTSAIPPDDVTREALLTRFTSTEESHELILPVETIETTTSISTIPSTIEFAVTSITTQVDNLVESNEEQSKPLDNKEKTTIPPQTITHAENNPNTELETNHNNIQQTPDEQPSPYTINPQDYDIVSLVISNDILTQELVELKMAYATQISTMRQERDSLRVELRLQEARFKSHIDRFQEAFEKNLATNLKQVQELTQELEITKNELLQLKSSSATSTSSSTTTNNTRNKKVTRSSTASSSLKG